MKETTLDDLYLEIFIPKWMVILRYFLQQKREKGFKPLKVDILYSDANLSS